MKKILCAFLALLFVLMISSCGNKNNGKENNTGGNSSDEFVWSREGSFRDENGDTLDIIGLGEEKGWYIGLSFLSADGVTVDKTYGWSIFQEGNALHGDLNPDSEDDHFVVTITEEGENGIMLESEGGAAYHFSKYDMEEPDIFVVNVNTEGDGEFAYAEYGKELIFEDWPIQSAQINLASPQTYSFQARTHEGSMFIKWMLNGNDYSTEEVISIEFTEACDLVAVFALQQEG